MALASSPVNISGRNPSKKLYKELAFPCVLTETGNFQFPWLSSGSDTEREQERLLLIQRYFLCANLVPSPGLCLMEFAKQVV